MKKLIWLLVIATYSEIVYSQQCQATIGVVQSESRITVSGTVTDQQGAVIAGAQISVKLAECTCKQCKPPYDKDCGCCANQIVRSDSAGNFRFSVPSGRYQVDVTAGELHGSGSVEASPGGSNTVHVTVH